MADLVAERGFGGTGCELRRRRVIAQAAWFYWIRLGTSLRRTRWGRRLWEGACGGRRA
jgi:hypothetical protein